MSRPYPFKTEPLSPTTLAYFAGMIDGDGSVSWSKRPVLSIANTYRPMLVEFQELVGGGQIVPRKSCLLDCTKPHAHSRKQGYRYVVRGERAYWVITQLEPFLKEKREKAQGIMARWEEEGHRNSSSATGVRQKMKSLGWVV